MDIPSAMTGLDICPTALPAWQKLSQLATSAKTLSLMKMFKEDAGRAQRMAIEHDGLLLDFSKNLVNDTIWETLLDLARQSHIERHRRALFAGEAINVTEGRAASHPMLRCTLGDKQPTEDDVLIAMASEMRTRMAAISEKIRSGQWLGITGKPVRTILHIGIGGSALGPQLACDALRPYSHPEIDIFFIANVDGAEILPLLQTLDPETTLVVVASKTFTTQETLINANTAACWLKESLGLENPPDSEHFIAITAQPENARLFGISESRILTFHHSVGGRYSLWSTVGLTVAIAVGFERFQQMLDGARAMDLHFTSAPLNSNLPVVMALLGIWYNNFLDATTVAIVPYCQRLSLLPTYLQQLDMESNGKSVSLSGQAINYATGPIIWGQPGTSGQHAVFQLLHQGTHLVPVDFIAAINDPLSDERHHSVLLNNMLAQAAALMCGQTDERLPPHKYHAGNRPSNILLCDELTPYNFGQIISLYEHKTFVQGSIWNINSYDQWGVELGKGIANAIQDGSDGALEDMDSSTKHLAGFIKKMTSTASY